jgi:hypothetical protein
MTPKHQGDEYPAKEAEQRRDAVLKAMLARPPEIHQPSMTAAKRKRRPKAVRVLAPQKVERTPAKPAKKRRK